MAIENVVWDMDHEPEGNVQHVAEYWLSKEDIEAVFFGVYELDTSRSSGRPIALGFNSAGEYICVVFEWMDDNTVYPVTAYVLED